MQPTLEQLDNKLDIVIEMLAELVTALADEAETVQRVTLDGYPMGGERDETMPL